ncbi:VWA domain-containing protein [Sphingobacteriaceae bacterium AH-315-L07]|nr:VWA domain-containing protein [Sphingobacteriaceae bacterium AH-315-L07]
MSDVVFKNQELLYLLLLLPVMCFWYWKKHKSQFVEMKVSSLDAYESGSSNWIQRFPHSLFVLRICAFGLLIIALARPQSTSEGKNVTTEGIDIVLALDISGSMLAEDFKPNRIDAAKAVATDFISGRPNDRIGLVIFAGESFTQCPLTTDHQVIKELMLKVKSGMIEDGTAIGMGLATAVNRIKESDAKSKVVILLTDGVNNKGFIDPMTAAEIAETFGIRVYTIGVGKKGTAPYPVQTPFGIQRQNMEVQIDEEVLKQIAEVTGGRYFRALNNKKLEEIYAEIDKLEKTKIQVTEFRKYAEEFYNFAMFAGLFLVLELFFRYTLLRTIP